MKYLLTIKYDGKNFYGWNKQPNLRTIHQTLENAFLTKFKNIKIVASGRTDRFVHSLKQHCDIGIDSKLNKNITKEINFLLNKEIEIIKFKKVDIDFSARYNSKSKTYLYKINNDFKNRKQEDENYFLNIYKKIDLKKLKKDTKKFLGEKNFASFTSKTKYVDCTRTINYIKIKQKKNFIFIEVNGNGFLRYMVRNIIGALIAKNFNKLTEDNFDELFKNPEIGKNIFKAKGQALYLKNVKY